MIHLRLADLVQLIVQILPGGGILNIASIKLKIKLIILENIILEVNYIFFENSGVTLNLLNVNYLSN